MQKANQNADKKEKKLKGNQKLALERIYRLFELAAENEKYAKRYVALAKRIGEKTRTSIPRELKTQHCTKCNSLKVVKTTKTPFLIIKCEECKHTKKYPLKNKEKN